MIISRQRLFEEIVDALEGYNSLVIIGCGTCATLCHSGGEEEVYTIAHKLEKLGKIIMTSFIIESVCTMEKSRRELKKRYEKINPSDALLVMSCGVGIQIIGEITEKVVIPGTDTLFIGSTRRLGIYEELCSLCGHCILEYTGGICPINRCSKGLLNGPCGGARAGHCEVDPLTECGWQLIYDNLKRLKKLELLDRFFKPCDFSKKQHPQKIDIREAILGSKISSKKNL